MENQRTTRFRRQLFVDPKVQRALVLRAVLYWVACLATAGFMLLCWRIITGPPRLLSTYFSDFWFQCGPPLLASIIVLPVIVTDMLRQSNRFVGPLVRLRRSMRALTRGECVEPIQFRGGDYWHEFAEEFNALATRVQDIGLTAHVLPAQRDEPSDAPWEVVAIGGE